MAPSQRFHAQALTVPCPPSPQLLRGANEYLLDEMERSLHDVLCVVGKVLESKSLVAGGGSVEAALSMYLESFATTLATKEQLAIREFAEALLVIPKALAVNAAQDATDLVAKLCAFHHASQTDESKAEYRFMGLDLVRGKVRSARRALDRGARARRGA